jgi:uncharacterized BrkB/YihY/UPF0761 family membrane protein
MTSLLAITIPSVIILVPIVILGLIGIWRRRLKRIGFVLGILGCFLLGLIAPVLATAISAHGLMYNFSPDEPKCVTGAATFLFFGYLMNLIGIPLLGIVLFPPREMDGMSK